MSDSFTLKLGSVDLSPYVRLAPGEGFDPVDATGFLEPQFGNSPFAEGQPLVSIDATNRELAWPLHLNDVSKDAVHALIRQINTEIATNPQLRVEWRDDGASNSTFYDVTFARFDPDFNFRRAQHNYESGTLRVWCAPPYGHTGTTRPVASVAATGIVAVVPVPSAILGDAPPLLDVFVRAGASSYFPAAGRIVGYAPLPHPSYAGKIPAASFIAGNGAFMAAASGAQDSNVMSFIGWPSAAAFLPGIGRFNLGLSPATAYAGGRHRVLAVARPGEVAGMSLRAMGPFGPLGATAVATYKDWSIVDLGVLSVPTDYAAATIGLTVQQGDIDRTTIAAGNSFTGVLYNASNLPGVTHLLVVPDDRLRVAVDSSRRTLAEMGGALLGASTTQLASGLYDGFGNQWTCPTYVAATALVSDFTSGAYIAALTNTGASSNAGASGRGMLVQHAPVEDMHAAAITLLAGAASLNMSLRKQLVAPSAPYFAGVVQATSLSIVMWDGSATTLLASVAMATRCGAAADTSLVRQDFGNQGDQLYVSVEYPVAGNAALVASLGAVATVWPGNRPGQAALRYDVAAVERLNAMWVESMPSGALGSRDGYDFKDTGAIQRQTSASVYNGDLSGQGRGAGLPPKTGSQVAAILAFAAPLEGGSGTDLLDVGVSVRERFQFAR